MAGHSFQRNWTGFGVRTPYNLRIVVRVYFAEKPRDARAPWAVFECLTYAAAAAAAISLG